jgi:hypothetical protein
MKFLKTLSLTVAVVVSLGLFAITSSAQPGHARWEGNNGRHLGWYKGRHRGWDRSWRDDDYYRRSRYRYYSYRNYYPSYYPTYRYGTTSSILNVLGLGGYGYRNYGYNNRYYGGTYISSRERRKLWKRYEKNRRRNYRGYGW